MCVRWEILGKYPSMRWYGDYKVKKRRIGYGLERNKVLS